MTSIIVSVSRVLFLFKLSFIPQNQRSYALREKRKTVTQVVIYLAIDLIPYVNIHLFHLKKCSLMFKEGHSKKIYLLACTNKHNFSGQACV